MGQVLRFEIVCKTRDFVILPFLSDSSCCSKRKRKRFNKMRFQQMCICCCPFTYSFAFYIFINLSALLGHEMLDKQNSLRSHFLYPPPSLLPYSSHILYLTSKLLSKLPHHKFPAYFRTRFPAESFSKISYSRFIYIE